MRTTIAICHNSQPDTSQVRNYWSRKEARLNKLLASCGEQAQLDLMVHYEAPFNRYAVRATLPLASATITVEALDENMESALDRVANLLEEALAQHEEGAGPSRADVDTISADSFPASDAPSWTPVTAIGNKS